MPNQTNVLRRIFLKITIYLSPLILVASVALFVSWQVGESIPLSMIINIQQSNSQTIVDQNWSRRDIIQYKLQSIIIREPEILVFGSSRSIFYRGTMFTEQFNAFFNANVFGMETQETQEIQQFVDILDERDVLPDTLILSIDPTSYRPSNNQVSNFSLPTFNDDGQRMIRAIVRGIPILLNPSLMDHSSNNGYQLFGTVARLKLFGFMSDGSTYRSDLVPSTIETLPNNNLALATGTRLDWEEINTLDEILLRLKEQHVNVIGVIHPYQSPFLSQVAADSYFDTATEAITSVFESHNYTLFNFTDPTSVGGSDRELFDFQHPGELLTLRMLAVMTTELPESLAQFTDVRQLNTYIETADNPFYVLTDRLE